MNKKIFIYLTFIGLIGLLFSCKKDETRAILSDSPVAPILQTVPDLTLKRANGTNMLTFVGTCKSWLPGLYNLFSRGMC